MTDTMTRDSRGAAPATEKSGKPSQGHHGTGVSPEGRGRTSIADDVVEKIAGMAAREVPGVHDLGAGMARTLGSVRDRVPTGRPSVTRGVKVEVGERQAAVDLDVVVEYDVDIIEIAGQVRSTVISEVEGMTGLDVVEVNIAVDDVHLPEEEPDDRQGDTRVE
jgi:uncharacterized alkaline shock family protein YloU